MEPVETASISREALQRVERERVISGKRLATLTRTLELPAEIHASQALLFPLRRLLEELCGVLRGGDTAVQSLRITLGHEDAEDSRLSPFFLGDESLVRGYSLDSFSLSECADSDEPGKLLLEPRGLRSGR